jgi:hypothetical protein
MENAFSIGLISGLYGGRYGSRHPPHSTAARTPATAWLLRFSFSIGRAEIEEERKK